MGNELAKSDFGDVAEKLRARIQAAFVDLIPPERWDEMLKAEVARFMQPTEAARDRWGNGQPARPAEFTVICQKVLTELVQAEVNKRFAEMNVDDVREKVAAWVEANTESVLRSFIRSMFEEGVREFAGEFSGSLARRLHEFIRTHVPGHS